MSPFNVSGSGNVVWLLLKNGADIQTRNKNNDDVLILAIEKGPNFEIMFLQFEK